MAKINPSAIRKISPKEAYRLAKIRRANAKQELYQQRLQQPLTPEERAARAEYWNSRTKQQKWAYTAMKRRWKAHKRLAKNEAEHMGNIPPRPEKTNLDHLMFYDHE